jgi:hypothetical protein
MKDLEGNIKLGHQAPKGWRRNECHHILIEGDLHYCWSHNFVYNEEEEERKLYNGEPCFYTDNRFYTPFGFNFYKDTYLYNRRFTPISIKAAIRRVLSCKGIPVGTIVQLNKSYYHPGKKIDNSYLFKIRKENPVNIKFEVNKPSYFDNFSTCERSRALVDALRANGFLVSVIKENENALSSLISSAGKAIGKKIEVKKEDGEIAVAYGHGKKIGFTSHDNSLFGYSYGVESILWAHYGHFNKWSDCHEISKTTPVDEIVKILIETKAPIDEDDF